VLSETLALVQQRIRHACQRSGRDPSLVTLVCVTKGVSPERMQEAVAAGVRDVGENRVQEAHTKQIALGYKLKAAGSSLQPPASGFQSVRWHLIGHLQRNKAKLAVQLFDVIHSVDSLALIEALQEAGSRTPDAGDRRSPGPLEVFIQVNVSGEKTKFGCQPHDAAALAGAITRCPNLRLFGLMTMAPLTQTAEAARPHFRRLRLLRDDLASSVKLPASSLRLSMGMSNDFEVAVEEGADYVRIGTAIFETGDRRQET
jgi:pyridoxal phosphate enzyme (YggS family)